MQLKKIKLYQKLSAKQMDRFLKQFDTNLDIERLIEIKNEKEDMYGDFIVIGGYKMKYTYGSYQCLETPTDKHRPVKVAAKKAPNDHYNWSR